MTPEDFSTAVLAWFDRYGRKNLPWQQQPNPYRVWVSEIMLQQTQVGTVIPYFERFMSHFPDVHSLADAAPDDVLHLWSGLGYYARARNLHRAAQIIRDQYGGTFPQDIDQLQALSGVGRSTAGAILSLACGQRHSILDGNVKRVLSRFQAVEGWPGQSAVLNRLWQLAETYTPYARVAHYTQAMMDMGATVCTRARPSCGICPLAAECEAHRQGREREFPASKPRKELPVRQTRLLMITRQDGAVLLEQRPPTGIWGGLWSLPECPPEQDLARFCNARFGIESGTIETWDTLRHTFSHFHLDITPVRIHIKNRALAVMEAGGTVWYNTAQPDRRGLAAPVQRLIERLTGVL